MADQNEKIGRLLKKLEDLLIRQDEFAKEIGVLRNEINELRRLENTGSKVQEEIKDRKEI